MLKRTILAFGIWAVASVAHADWQFTKWGMTRAEVIAASGGLLTEQPQTPKVLNLKGPYTVAGIPFETVSLGFNDAGKLDYVGLVADDKHSYQIEQALAAAAGRPVMSEPGAGAVRIYRDAAKGNAIEFRRMGEKDFVTYRPIDRGF